MISLDFDKRVLIEQIRYIEMEYPLAGDAEQLSPDHSVHGDFEQRLWHRARRLADHHDLSAVLEHAASLMRRVKIVVLFIAAFLGALGAGYAVTDSNTINIYWLLLVLLGFNFLSMLLWLAGISLNMKGLAAGILAKITRWRPGHFKSSYRAGSHAGEASGKLADRAWLASHFSGAVGKWQFSKITHQLWLVYLLAGLVFLGLVLMFRQYDFVWGTTLLSDTAFIKLTELMSTPLQALGFTTPSAEQVQATRTGMQQVPGAELRGHWAQFMLGALLCFGIVPRILLLIWSALMCVHVRRRFALDYYHPYYISLRQQMMPLASHGQIIDADTSPPANAQIAADTSSTADKPYSLPAETLWVAVELDADISWPPLSVDADRNLGEVIDRASLGSIQQKLQQNDRPVLAVAVVSARLPDRGVQRTIHSLVSNSKQAWLVLLQSHHGEKASASRLAAWYRLAEACKVPADHVIRMNLDRSDG